MSDRPISFDRPSSAGSARLSSDRPSLSRPDSGARRGASALRAFRPPELLPDLDDDDGEDQLPEDMPGGLSVVEPSRSAVASYADGPVLGSPRHGEAAPALPPEGGRAEAAGPRNPPRA